MSQYLYNKVILEKIAAEKEKSNDLLNALGVGAAATGIGGGVGYGVGRYKGNKGLSHATNVANAARDTQIKDLAANMTSFENEVARAQSKSWASNVEAERLRESLDDLRKKALDAATDTRNHSTKDFMNYHKAHNEYKDASAAHDDAIRNLQVAKNKKAGYQKTVDELTDRANREAADAISGATAKRLDTIKKYTKGGLGVGLGVGLGAYGAKKLYDRYKGTEKKASYTYAVLEKLAQDGMGEQNSMKAQAAQAAGLGASTLAGGLAARNLLNRASKAHAISHKERATTAFNALNHLRGKTEADLEDIDNLSNMTKRWRRSEMVGKVLNNKYTRGVGMGMGAIGMGALGKKAYDAYKE